MAEPVLCLKCKRPVRAESEFCPNCGQRLKKRCVSTACDAVLSFADTHCFKCGTPQGGTNALSGVLSRIDGEKAVKVGQGVGGCLLAPFKFLIQTFIGAGPIGWIALLLLPILLVLCGFINNLTKGLAGQILIIWPLQMLGGSIISACLLPVFLLGLVALIFVAVRKKWLQRVTVWAQAHGRENRARRLEEQRRRAEENARRTAALRPIAPPAPVQPAQLPPPEQLTRILPLPLVSRRTTKRATRAVPASPTPVGFSKEVREAQITRIALRVNGDRALAREYVRQAMMVLDQRGSQDFSATALKKAVDEVYGDPSI